ncbi:MAG: universal stress protein [Deltaproteobacteria bacterium]|jgi:nucleotide-binding universal stress UspA family protein|nr:universal stress protein [Deltaproteobacteria bacterium]
MVADIQKMIIVPVDGSENALKSLDYINLIFGPQHNLKTTLFYALPRLPPILLEESKKDGKTLKKLRDLEKKNTAMAEHFLAIAKDSLIKKGFAKAAVEAVFRKIELGIARDIVNWSEKKRADAVILSTRGRSKLVTFFLGEIANKVLEYSRVCPIWMVKGSVKKRHALLAIDNSKNALRTVDHAGFMLSGTDAKVTIFHSKRDLKHFIPSALVEEFPEFQKHWLRKAGKEITPFMQKAKDMLLAAGLREDQIATKVIDGSRSAAADIVKEAQDCNAGSIFLGLRGYSSVKEYTMGSVTRKVLNQAEDMAVCIVP